MYIYTSILIIYFVTAYLKIIIVMSPSNKKVAVNLLGS